MPIHDWSRVDPGLFHHFHRGWTCALADALNAKWLPRGYFALLEKSHPSIGERNENESGTDAERYAARTDRIAIRKSFEHVVAVIEIVSPGNKGSRTALRAFVLKSVDLLRQGINLLVIDLFPPSARDSQGIHRAIWDEICEEPFELPAGRPLTLVSYLAGPTMTACVEPVAVGDVLPDMPLFLEGEQWVPIALQETYQTTWLVCPEPLREAVETTSGSSEK